MLVFSSTYRGAMPGVDISNLLFVPDGSSGKIPSLCPYYAHAI